MTEHFAKGPLLALRNSINDALLQQRNVEALRRLGDMTGRYQPSGERTPVPASGSTSR